MRRLVTPLLLAIAGLLLGVAGVACSVPGGKVASPTPETVVGSVPTSTTTTVSTPTTVPSEFENGDATAGKEVFTKNGCAACHTLQDADAKGNVGPNLDDAKPALALVVDRVSNGKGAMPPFKGQLTTKQIADVAAYVVEATQG